MSKKDKYAKKRLIMYIPTEVRESIQGRIQDFKLGGGGGGTLKKIAPSRGRRKNFGGISCEKSRFSPQK